jgi:haloalkane dehalogenase
MTLPGWEYETRRCGPIAYVDEGDGPAVVLVHGQPTWGYLWRRVLPPLLDAGFRCVVPDHLGFGRSEKPLEREAYSFATHAANLEALLDELDLRDVTMVVHDWGGPIGLRVAVDRPDRVTRLVLMDTGLLSGHQKMGDTWLAFRQYVRETPELPVGELVSAGCRTALADDVRAAFDAPFPGGAADQGGVHAFPELVPTEPDAPEAADHRRVWAALKEDERPMLTLWADADIVFPVERGRRFLQTIGAPEPIVIPDAGHFLQEDAGDVVGAHIRDWLRA